MNGHMFYDGGAGGLPMAVLAAILALLVLAPAAAAQEDGGEGTMGDVPGGDTASDGDPEGGGEGQTGVGINDVVVTGISFSDDEPVEGDVIVITVTVSNVGAVPVDDVNIIVMEGETDDGGGFGPGGDDGQQSSIEGMEEIGNFTGLELESGASTTVEVRWTAEKYDHSISALRVVDGTPLTNTMVSAPITVAAEPLGDAPFLLLTLAAIFISVLIASMLPAFYNSVINGKGGR